MSYNGPALPVRFPVCKEDFAIWDRVLAKLPGVPLEVLSRERDRRDALVMSWREEYRAWARTGRLAKMTPADAVLSAMRVRGELT